MNRSIDWRNFLKVAILAQYYPPDMGGGATRAMNLAEGLAQDGVSVTVISAFPHYPHGNTPKEYRWKPLVMEYDKSIRVIRTFVPPIESTGFFRRFLLFIAFMVSCLYSLPLIGKIDILFTSNPNVLSLYPGAIIRRIKGCKIIQNVDDLWPEALKDLGVNHKSLFYRLGRLMAYVAYRIADGIVPISPGYVPTIIQDYGIKQNKIKVIKAGVNLDFFDVLPGNANPHQKFRILYIGAFSPAYNFDQVFESAEILKNYDDIEFIIQGGGEMASYLKQLERKYSDANISVVDEIISREEVVKKLQAADALLLPLCGVGSIELGISSKIYEYQAAGKPILCCSSGQPGMYVKEINSGIVTKPGESMQLAEAILHLKNNPDSAKLFGQNGRKYVESNLSVSEISKEMREFFMKIIGGLR